MKSYELVIQDSPASAEDRVVEVIGCLDSHTVVRFEKSLDELLEVGVKRLELNMEKLSYISSAGISALMGLTHRLRQINGDLVLVRPTEKVYRVFRTLGFTSIFTIKEGKTQI